MVSPLIIIVLVNRVMDDFLGFTVMAVCNRSLRVLSNLPTIIMSVSSAYHCVNHVFSLSFLIKGSTSTTMIHEWRRASIIRAVIETSQKAKACQNN